MKLSTKIFWISLTVYVLLRVFSFAFTPPTPLWTGSIINSLVASAILLCAGFWFYKKDNRAWAILITELILGGGGGYLSVGPLSLRTSLLVLGLSIFTIQNYRTIFSRLRTDWSVRIIMALVVWAGVSGMFGILSGHGLAAVFSNFVPYLYLLLYIPFSSFEQNFPYKQYLVPTTLAAIAGNAMLILFTLLGFATKYFVLQDTYYHWYRDVAGGKITALADGYYRLVLNEHLLLPVLVIISIYLLTDRKYIINKLWAFFGLLFILSTNLTRIYFLAIAVGSMFLFAKTNWKRILVPIILTPFCFLAVFTSTHYLTTGKDAGLSLLGLRFQSIAAPQIEDSSLSRMLLLPEILKKIKATPVFGQGLGDAVTVWSPVYKQNITTPHFDWGYLEIWAESGLIGLFLWAALICYVIKRAWHRPAIRAILIALLVANITSPALFHVFGTLIIVYCLVKTTPTPLPKLK